MEKLIIEKLKSINFKRYTTNSTDYFCWFDQIYQKIPISPIILSLIIFIILYLFGLIVSSFISFSIEFIKSPIIYIAIFGISWVFYISHWGSVNIHKALEELRPCFIIKDNKYKIKLNKWFNIFIDTKKNLYTSITLFIIVFIFYYIGFYHPEFPDRYHLICLRPIIVPNYWFVGSFKIVKFIILLFYIIIVCLLLGTASRMLIVNLGFLLDLRKFPIIPISNIVRSRLRKLTDYYIKISISWFVGVSLFGILFYYKIDIVSISIISILSLIGILTFLTPQILFRKYLMSSYKTLCDISIINFYKNIGVNLNENNHISKSGIKRKKIFELNSLVEMIDLSSKPPLWVYDSEDFLILLFGQLLAFLGIFLQKIADKILY